MDIPANNLGGIDSKKIVFCSNNTDLNRKEHCTAVAAWSYIQYVIGN